MSQQSPLYYAPDNSGWHVYVSDIVRQIMLTIIANLIIVNIKPIIYIISAGRLDWIVLYWIGSDYQTTFKHILRQLHERRNPLHLLVIIGIAVSILVSVAPSLLVFASPARVNTVGSAIGNSGLYRTSASLLALGGTSPQADVIQTIQLGDQILDSSLLYSLSPSVFPPVYSQGIPFGTIATSRGPMRGVMLNLTAIGNASQIPAILFNSGNDGLGNNTRNFFDNSLILRVLSSEGSVPNAQYSARADAKQPFLTVIKPGVGDDILIATASQIIFLQYQSSKIVSQEPVLDRQVFSLSSNYLAWQSFVSNAVADTDSIALTTNTLQLQSLTVTTSPGICNLTLGQLSMQCTATVMNGSMVSFGHITWSPGTTASNGILALSLFSYRITVVAPADSSTSLVKGAIVSPRANQAPIAGGWFAIPGELRRDAFNLALASLALMDNSNGRVSNGFMATSQYRQYDGTVLLIILLSLILSTALVQATRHVLYERLKKEKNESVGYVVEYDLVVESMSSRDSVSFHESAISTLRDTLQDAERAENPEEMQAIAGGDSPRTYGSNLPL